MSILDGVLIIFGTTIFTIILIQFVDFMERLFDRLSFNWPPQKDNGWRVKIRRGVYTEYNCEWTFLKTNVSWKTWLTRGAIYNFGRNVKAPKPYTRIDTYLVPDELVIKLPDSSNGDIQFYRFRDDSNTIVTFKKENIHLLERDYVNHAEYYRDSRVPTSDCAIVTTITSESPRQAAEWLPMFRQYRFGWLEKFWLGQVLSKLYSQWTPHLQCILENDPILRLMINDRYIKPTAQLLKRAEQAANINRFLLNIRVLIRYAIGVGHVRLAIALNRS